MFVYEVFIRNGYIETCSVPQLALYYKTEVLESSFEIAKSFSDSFINHMGTICIQDGYFEDGCDLCKGYKNKYTYCPNCGFNLKETPEDILLNTYYNDIWRGNFNTFPNMLDFLMEEDGWFWWNNNDKVTHKVFLYNYDQWIEKELGKKGLILDLNFASTYFEGPFEI